MIEQPFEPAAAFMRSAKDRFWSAKNRFSGELQSTSSDVAVCRSWNPKNTKTAHHRANSRNFEKQTCPGLIGQIHNLVRWTVVLSQSRQAIGRLAMSAVWLNKFS